MVTTHAIITLRPRWTCVIITLLGWLTGPSTRLEARLLRCVRDEDCPSEGVCFRDECARCLCPSGMRATDLYTNGRLTSTCHMRPEVSPKIGEECVNNVTCPSGSFCHPSSRLCVCSPGYVAHADRNFCRLSVYGENCNATHACDGTYGYTCDESKGKCVCMAQYRRPSDWANFIMTRWNYDDVAETPQECLTRTVGEPCTSDEQCGAVGGSGARCSPCGFCECRVPNHVPDILGDVCGPGLGMNKLCSLYYHDTVCDGTQGLQCGDVCSLYVYDSRPKTCTCSQMHDRQGNTCVPKTVGRECGTDLDCYLITEGYGFCHKGRCQAQALNESLSHEPYSVARNCLIHDHVTTTKTTTVRSTTTLHIKTTQKLTSTPENEALDSNIGTPTPTAPTLQYSPPRHDVNKVIEVNETVRSEREEQSREPEVRQSVYSRASAMHAHLTIIFCISLSFFNE